MKPANNGIDLIIEEQNEITRAFAESNSQAFIDEIFSNTVGQVQAFAAATSVALNFTEVIGLEIADPLASANGADVIKGKATATAIAVAVANAETEVFIEAINNSAIDVVAQAQAFAEALVNVTAVGIDNNSKVTSGNGADLIVGEATSRGIGLAIANALANVEAIADDTSEVNTFTATLANANVEVNSTSIGIRGGEYDLGNGDDTIRAIATGEGVNIGVQDVLINAGRGADTFDLQSGTGVVIGGKGKDLLVLEGNKTDYTFTELTSTLGVTIQNNNTDLNVSEVESFAFAEDSGTVFDYSDLFI